MNYDLLSWKDIIISGAAILGAVLGIMNTWNSISQRRLRLRVTPVHIISANGAGFAIQIINLSSFPVTVAEIGFLERHGTGHLPVMQHAVYDGGSSIPRRLEPRESISVHFDLRIIIGRKKELSKAYVRTACGAVVSGNSGALKQILNERCS